MVKGIAVALSVIFFWAFVLWLGAHAMLSGALILALISGILVPMPFAIGLGNHGDQTGPQKGGQSLWHVLLALLAAAILLELSALLVWHYHMTPEFASLLILALVSIYLIWGVLRSLKQARIAMEISGPGN